MGESQNRDVLSDIAREQESKARVKVLSGQITSEEYLAELDKVCSIAESAENENKGSAISIENAFVHYQDAYESLVEVSSAKPDASFKKKLQELKTKLESLLAGAQDAEDSVLVRKLQNRLDRIGK